MVAASVNYLPVMGIYFTWRSEDLQDTGCPQKETLEGFLPSSSWCYMFIAQQARKWVSTKM
jgi:hypothetical protein